MKFDGIRWVWLDLDDTLIDFKVNSRAALRIVYDECDIQRFIPTADEWVETYEAHNHSLWDRYSRQEITQDFLRVDRFFTPLRQGWKGSADELVKFSWELDTIYLDRLARQKTLLPGAMELLDHLSAHNYNIGILSNGFTEVQHAKLTNTGIGPKIDLVVLSDDIGVNKPDTRLYNHAMERAGDTDPNHHLMIGDNLSTDIRGALDSGWHAIHLDRSQNGTPEWGASYLVTHDLPSITAIFMRHISP